MTDERRYGEDEIAEILEEATVARGALPARSAATGLTLHELQEIGSDVGISPERIAEAAKKLAVRAAAPTPERFLGATRSVSHTVHLDRPLSDGEWSRVVAELRRTFKAKGSVEGIGDLRSWTNGNLQVHMEPDSEGYRLRMGTRKGNVTELTFGGLMMVAMGMIMIMAGLSKAEMVAVVMGWMFSVGGLGAVAYVRATLPGWARTRANQMEELEERLPSLLDRPRDPEPEA